MTTYKPTNEHRQFVKTMAAVGIPPEQICMVLEDPTTGKHIERELLEHHFKTELETGAITARAKVLQTIYTAATNPGKDAVKAATFWIDNNPARPTALDLAAMMTTMLAAAEAAMNREYE